MSAIGTLEKIEIAEVLNEIVKRACLFENPKATPPPTTTTTATTAYRKAKVEAKAKDEVEAKAKDEVKAFKTEEVDRVLVQPVVAEAAYPNLVSNNKMIH